MSLSKTPGTVVLDSPAKSQEQFAHDPNTGWLTWIARPDVNGVLSAVGLVLTLIGFGVSIYMARKAKSAAEQARMAADSVRDSFIAFDAAAACLSAVQALEELERAHRSGPIGGLLDRYALIRRNLIQIRSSHSLTDSQQIALQSTITHLANFAKTVERQIRAGDQTVNAPRLNQILGSEIESMLQLAHELRTRTITTAPSRTRVE